MLRRGNKESKFQGLVATGWVGWEKLYFTLPQAKERKHLCRHVLLSQWFVNYLTLCDVSCCNLNMCTCIVLVSTDELQMWNWLIIGVFRSDCDFMIKTWNQNYLMDACSWSYCELYWLMFSKICNQNALTCLSTDVLYMHRLLNNVNQKPNSYLDIDLASRHLFRLQSGIFHDFRLLNNVNHFFLVNSAAVPNFWRSSS